MLESLLFSKVRARNIAYNSIWRLTGFFNLKRRNSRLELNIHSKKKKKKKNLIRFSLDSQPTSTPF